MPWTQKQMLRDANGDLIPQYWDVVEQEFKPLTGRDGANDVRLTGSYIVNGFEDILPKIGTIAPGTSAIVEVDLLSYGFPINSITLIGRNDSGEPIEIRVRNMYLLPSGGWSSTAAIEDVFFPSSNSVGIKTTRYEPLSQKVELLIRNNGTADVKLTALAVMFWR